MTVNLLTVAGFTGLGLFLLAAVWYWHAQYQAQRIRAEQSDDWSDYWQHWSEEWRDRAERATAPTFREVRLKTHCQNQLRESTAHNAVFGSGSDEAGRRAASPLLGGDFGVDG